MSYLEMCRTQIEKPHIGSGAMPRPDSYNKNHTLVLSALTSEWSSSREIWRRMKKEGRPCEMTVRHHLMDLAVEGKVEQQKGWGGREWRRVR